MLTGLLFISLTACQDEASNTAQIVRVPSQTEARDWTSGADDLDFSWYVRASLDIRGHRPSASELEWAIEHPNELGTILEMWFAEPAYAHQMAWYWNDLLHTAVWIGQEERFDDFDLQQQEVNAVGWEPLAYIEQTILDERPFTDIVTLSTVPTNATLGSIFGDEFESQTWDLVTTDREHPAAGVLASRVLWIRHYVDFLNHNRARANFYTSTFLCQDYLERDVSFDFSQVSLDNVESAIRSQPECVTCHASLDPLASVFGTFQDSISLDLDQMGMPSTFKQRWFAGLTEPNYFGLPLNDIGELGAYTAADSRFSQCMVEQTWGFFVEDAPLKDLDKLALAEVFESSNYSMKTLTSYIVQAPEYRAQEPRVLRPEQLLQTLIQLGDLSVDPSQGIGEMVWSPEHRVLFGSTDDIGVLTANPSFTVGHHLALEWLTSELASVIQDDLSRPIETRALLTEWDGASEAPLGQILRWKRTLHSEWVDESNSEVQELMIVWSGLQTGQGDVVAWSTVLAILLHDPRAVIR